MSLKAHLCLQFSEVLPVEEAWACFRPTVSCGVPEFELEVESPRPKGSVCVLCSGPWLQTRGWV